ncbi:MAG: hypothetical protein KAV87_02925 [Desulfobacteraceae bacterium]|nr:hypothetical protein [Desulfobacteraceae bacterium]
MKRFTKGTLPDTDVGPEKTGLDVWEKPVPKESLQTIRNVGRIEQLEAKQTDLEQWLKILAYSQSSQWITPRASSRVQSLSWRELANMPDIVFELDEDVSPWERAQLAIQPIGPAIDQILPPYHDRLTTVTKLFGELEGDFDEVGRRIVRCTLLEEELGHLEDSLESDEKEGLAWCVSLIRDVLDYNFAEDLTETHLGLLKKAIGLVHDKGSDCNKEDYQSLHKEFLQTGLALLPTTQKAIDKYGD